MGEIVDKIDQVLIGLSGLNARFDGIEKKVDAIEDELRCIRIDASKNSERVVRLEESHKNLSREVERTDSRLESNLKRVEKNNSEDIQAIMCSIDEKIDKKLLALKLAIYTSITAAVFSISQFAFGLWKALK